MRRNLKIPIFFALVFILLLSFSSCGHKHTPAAAIKENETQATCTTDGSYDTVMYCNDCDYEFLRFTTTVPSTGHIPRAAVKENEKASTCVEIGSYDTVMYCKDCDYEFLRQTQIVPVTEHDVKDGACRMCNTKESSVGLKFSLNPDGKSYTVIDVGECTDSEIVIGVYNGLSVTQIADEAFEGCDGVAMITISHCVTNIGFNAFGMCNSLENVIFESPSEWRYVSGVRPGLSGDFSSTELADSSIAAQYLVSDYNGCYWKRG